jgi:hypothetical protein
MHRRPLQRRTLVRDFVLRAIGIVLHRLTVVLDRRVEVPGPHRPLAAHERTTRRTRGKHDGQHQNDRTLHQW